MGIQKASGKQILADMRKQVLAVAKVRERLNKARKDDREAYDKLVDLEDQLRKSKDFEYYIEDFRKVIALRRKYFI